jgi:hypothetical protein
MLADVTFGSFLITEAIVDTKVFSSPSARNKIYITSWVGGGVSDILPYYVDRDLKSSDAVMVLRSIKDVAISDVPIFKVSIYFKSKQKSESFVLQLLE